MKSHLRIDGTDEDVLLDSLIKAAREYVEDFQGRALITQTWEMTLDSFPQMPLKVPKPPLQTVDSIKYVDQNGVETIFDAANYVVDTDSEPGRIAFAYGKSWPSVTLKPINGVKIQFKAGYGDDAASVPEKVKIAMLLYIAHRYMNRETDEVPSAVDMLLWPDRMVPV